MLAMIEHRHKETNDVVSINYSKEDDNIVVQIGLSLAKDNGFSPMIKPEIVMRMTCNTIREYIDDLFKIENNDNIPVPEYTVNTRNGNVLEFDSKEEYIKMVFSGDEVVDKTMIPYEYDKIIEYLKKGVTND